MRTAQRPFALLVAAAVWGCAPPADAPADPHVLPLLGTAPFTPLEKVSFTLTDTEERPYDFRARTDGHITLLFFGYTYCPDICPVHMATLSGALRELDAEARDRVRMVFVSVDPARDTPERLRQWLSAFDSTFVGLTGTDEQIAEALAFYRYPPPETSGEEVGYTVGHPASIYAFTPDDLGRAMYGVETTKAMWVHDLELMAEHEWPAVEELIEVTEAYAPAPPTGERTAVYLTLVNGGASADTLRGVRSDVAATGSVHDMVTRDGMMHMVPMHEGLPLPPGDTVRLEPGRRHGMLEGLLRPLVPGETIQVTLHFARAGTRRVPVHVVRYEDVVR